MSRLAPLRREDFPDLEPVFQLVEAGMGFLPNSMLIMARRPALVQAFAGLGAEVQLNHGLPDGLREMIAYMASKASGCLYCQAHTHHGVGANNSIAAEKMADIWSYETSDLFSDAERAALRVAQGAGQVPNAVDDADFGALKKHFNETEIVGIVSIISFFGFLNRWNDTFGTALEDVPLEHGEQHLAKEGWDAGKHAQD